MFYLHSLGGEGERVDGGDAGIGGIGDTVFAVFREREKELLLEDHYYYDVRRNGVDYVRRELPGAYPKLSDQDIKDGALYLMINSLNFEENDLMRQNVYWNRRQNEIK